MTAVQQAPTAETDEFPSLLEWLQRHFTLVPRYSRELDDRIAETRFDPATGGQRDVTEHELVVGRLGGPRFVFGGRIRRSWDFVAADGTPLEFNPMWDRCRHMGVRHPSVCTTCGGTRWNRADRRALDLCKLCRGARRVRCELDPDLACSTRYVKAKCRCDACRAWKRASRRIGNSVSPETSTYRKASEGFSPDPGTGLTQLPAAGPATWTWFPEDVRMVLQAYLNAEAAHGKRDEARRRRGGAWRKYERPGDQPATLGRIGEAASERWAGADGAERWAQERPQQVPRGARRVQAGLQVLLARGPVAADGTVVEDIPGIGLVRVVAA